MSSNTKQHRLTALIVAGFVLSGCQAASIKTQPVSKELAAHPVSAQQVGYKRITTDTKGKVRTAEVVSVEDDLYQYKTSDGYAWENYPNPILPSPSFSGPDWGNGTQQISNVNGSMFPLTVGNKMSYTVVGKSSKNPGGWSDNRKCEVTSQERITVVAGEYDAFKVVCDGKWSKRVYFFSPEVNDIVFYRDTHKTDPQKTNGWELAEIPSAAS